MTSNGGALPSIGSATAAAANPPSTSEPSPPMTMSPMRAGSATASAVRINGDERCNVF